MPKSTLSDVARIAGVSLATVDRVLNNRSGVSDRTRRQVRGAAKELGVIEAEKNTLAPVRLSFVLPDGTNTFVHDLARHALEQAAISEEVTVQIDLVRGFDPTALAERVTALATQVDGMAILGADHPLVRETLRGAVAKGKKIVTLGSDVRMVDHLGYVGIDDTQAGRLAGYLIGRLLRGGPGKIAFFAGSLTYRGHQEREMGFRQIIGEEYPELQIVEHREVRDSRALAHQEMTEVLTKVPDLAAVYNAGGGTAGIAAALQETGRADGVIFIAHDATAGNKAFLLQGVLDAVIDQNARLEAREAITTLVHAVRGASYRMVPPRLQIIFRENIPSA